MECREKTCYAVAPRNPCIRIYILELAKGFEPPTL